MQIVPNLDLRQSFDEVYCLTLEGDLARQRHASAELCAAGIPGFKFIEGVKADSLEVAEAFRGGRVHSFPPCFPCGNLACGSDDCNNVLIEPQVGCFLSFLKIFRIAVDSGSRTFLTFEDDVKFPDYAPDLARVALARERLGDLGFFSSEPCLIGLGRGKGPAESWNFDGKIEFLPGRKLPQNPCFAFNRAFAEMALDRFRSISHTVDVYIHYELSSFARHYSLEPPFAYELSASSGALPSRIHPKAVAFENPSNSPVERAAAKKPLAWVWLERAAQDVPQLFTSGLLRKKSEPDLEQLSKITNAEKPYLGQVYRVAENDFEEMFRRADPFLQDRYWALRNNLTHAFARP